ncbi:methyltransferase domain-containing protein [Sphingobium phenoxybenzoativorans]|uniref:Methyltransferase domain-containing protein n=1 Tax=Sphingobium phenoxybenzoativorans TaxID=1592790 RepID=A0A975K6G4_9SPHN|nr:methyltransferase domain-containing protein [Sphingobium phenoxybenzoativorans]QUT05678.1 methyltransferase domain-containing protein [Sphingobium phenoxybenzoativorans]
MEKSSRNRAPLYSAGKAVRNALRRLGSRWRWAARSEPLSRNFGFDRGTPIDRHYIELFLGSHAHRIAGRVLEIGDATYSRRFGVEAVSQQEVLHVHPGNPVATIVGDISDPLTLEDAAFDCIILTQTIHLIYDMKAALLQIRRALKPGGVLLLTAPGITPLDQYEWQTTWYWSLSPIALQRLVDEVFGSGSSQFSNYGNFYAASAFIDGAALEEVNMHKLTGYDPVFPVIVAACATKMPAAVNESARS